MAVDTEKVKDLVRKLLNVTRDDAATEGEIDNALRFAKGLMDKHHMDEEDLVQEPEDQWKSIEAASRDRVFVSVGGKFFAWEDYLSAFCVTFVGGVGVYKDPSKSRIARNHRGIVILNEEEEPYKGVRYCFYGIAEDAMMAAELFHELRMTIRTMARLRYGTCYTRDGGMYAQGFVAGLRMKIERQEKEQRKLAQSDNHALILIERRQDLIERKLENAQRWLKKLTGIKLVRGPLNTGANGSAAAYHEGKEDGNKADVSAVRRPKIC